MRTILVRNPRRRNRRRRRNTGGPLVLRNATLLPNPRRRRRTKPTPCARVTRRNRRRSYHRRNATPFYMSNPRRHRRNRRRHRRNALILPNRRRYRRNPSFSLSGAFNTVFTGALGGGGAWLLNNYAIMAIGRGQDGGYGPNADAANTASATIAPIASVQTHFTRRCRTISLRRVWMCCGRSLISVLYSL